ncbi:MAG: DNA adenine methylase [Myxococcota bacterium]|nr:DNA adenine methylase [Myxococcota bacterium]
MIKYLGSKRTLITTLTQLIQGLDRVHTVIDLFSGTSRVGHALKASGYRVRANDHNAYAATLARCYVQADADEHQTDAERLIREFNQLPGRDGYFTETFCRQSRFFQPANGARIDAIREAIAEKDLEPELEAIVLTSLLEAADRVDSTTGVQMAYLKQWAPRAHKPLELRVPAILPRAGAGKGEAHMLDALQAARCLEGDLTYLDPPYNQHKYLGNYHVWETLVRWDAPEAYGTARKRVDCRERRSPFNSKPGCLPAFEQVVGELHSPYLLVSFSNEGFIDREQMGRILSARGHVTVLERPYRRYVGAQIGIHDPRGRKVGEVSHLHNRERIFLVSPEPVTLPELSDLLVEESSPPARAGSFGATANPQ